MIRLEMKNYNIILIEKNITEDGNGQNVPHLEIMEVVLIHCNVINNSHQFVPTKSFGQLLDISPENVTFLKTFDSKFSYIELWFTVQNSYTLKIEDKINITLVTN